MSTYTERRVAFKRDLIPATPKPVRECWRRVQLPGLERYEASNLGAIRYRFNGHARPVKVQTAPSARYPQFSFFDNRDGRRKTIRLHRAACSAWHGKPPHPKAIAEHKDDNPQNCRARNLKWSTHRENHRTALRAGRVPGIGPEAALAVREAYAPTRGRIKALRQQFGLCNKSLRMILNGTSYPEISGGRPVPGYPRGA